MNNITVTMLISLHCPILKKNEKRSRNNGTAALAEKVVKQGKHVIFQRFLLSLAGFHPIFANFQAHLH